MNCRDAEKLIFAERDGALTETQRAALAKHLDDCAACRSVPTELAAATNAWRRAGAAASVPTVEIEWHAIRRRIRGEESASTETSGWRRPLGWSLAAAAAIALAAFVGPRWWQSHGAASTDDWAYVSFVEVHGSTESTMVYEDQQSGWLVVWVGDTDTSLGT